MQILTWEQYCSLHNVVTKDEFEKAEAKAEIEVGRVIGMLRWNELKSLENLKNELFYDQLCECVANLIDYNETIAKNVGAGITSVSNDGYSETYSTAVQTASDAFAEKSKNIKAWLSGTGLVGAY